MPLLGVFGVFTTVGVGLMILAGLGIGLAGMSIGFGAPVGVMIFTATLSIAFKLFYKPLYLGEQTLEVQALKQLYKELDAEVLRSGDIVVLRILESGQQDVQKPDEDTRKDENAGEPNLPGNSATTKPSILSRMKSAIKSDTPVPPVVPPAQAASNPTPPNPAPTTVKIAKPAPRHTRGTGNT